MELEEAGEQAAGDEILCGGLSTVHVEGFGGQIWFLDGALRISAAGFVGRWLGSWGVFGVPTRLTRVCVCRGSNAGVPGVWVFHVGSSGPLEHVEPGGNEGGSPGTPQSPAVPTEPPARPGWAPTSPRPRHHGQLSIVPVGLPVSPGQERSRRLQPEGHTPQRYPANPASYSSGHHGVGVEEDVHFNTDGEIPG